MNKEFELKVVENDVVITFNNSSMPEYFLLWFNEVGNELFEASLIDINQ